MEISSAYFLLREDNVKVLRARYALRQKRVVSHLNDVARLMQPNKVVKVAIALIRIAQNRIF